MTREQLEEGRHIGKRVYGYKKSWCCLHSSCKDCDKIVRFGCKVINYIEKLQVKRILRICK